MRRRCGLIVALVCLVSASGTAVDWPQLLGPTRNGIYTGPPLLEQWPASGPHVVWKTAVGQGLSGPVVAGGQVILFHRMDDREVVEALDPATGATRWRYDYPTTYRDDFGFDEGPRAVPVVADGVVYTFGAQGQLHAVDLAKGTRVWSEDTMRRFQVPKAFFGQAGSPLVVGGRVIANVGGAEAGIVAFEAKSGRVLWTATKDGASYSSGVSAVVDGHPTAIFLTRNGVVGVDPDSGGVRFEQPWRSRSAASVNAASPLIVGDLMFISAEYGPGAAVFQLGASTLGRVWASDEVLSTHYATSVHRDGVLYGYHGRQEFGPSLRAVELRTGKVLWSVDRFRAGSILLAGPRLLIARESGELVLAEASREGFKPLAQARVLPATVRGLPAVDDGHVYLRNEDTLICLDLRLAR
ncbi:MAG: PQQ-like beta-propeller repeat protein [Acidobacteriota bacterium]|nr:PQQ-like beta-propeller repeat protein [Acidobacteriota bacterium]